MTLPREFHEKFGLPVADAPTPQHPAVLRLQLRLIREEYEEVRSEFGSLLRLLERGQPGSERVDAILSTLGLLLKELCDLRYMIEGTAEALGLDIDGAYAAVHASNMTKMGQNASGKVLKGPDYVEPDMTAFVQPIINVEEIE